MKPQLANLTYTPRFFDPAKANGRYNPDISGAFLEGAEYGRLNRLKTGQQLIKAGVGHSMMLTDLQAGDFGEGGRLPVKGTNDVVLRTCTRILNGTVVDYYAGFIFSLDGHPNYHTSFGTSYVDKDRIPLDLSKHGNAAILTLADEKAAVFKATAFGPDGPYEVGYYQRIFDPLDAVAYWNHLQATQQGPIWVFVPHCVIGTDGTNLHPLLVETLAFVSGARGIQPTIIHKGHLANTDWFGPLEPCRPDPNHPQGGLQKGIIDEMKLFVSIEFAGVAEDFCDYNMKAQTLKHLAGTDYIGKLRFLSDCTAPIIPNAAHVLKLNTEAQAAGVKFIDHTSPFEG